MAHIHDKIDFGADVFIVHKSKVLLRIHDKYKMWLPPGGHIELDEDPCEAAVREAKEEVGLDITLRGEMPQFPSLPGGHRSILAPRFVGRHNIDENHEHVIFYYLATSETDHVVVGGDDRSEEWKWFTEDELGDPSYDLREDTAFYARAALRELGAIPSPAF